MFDMYLLYKLRRARSHLDEGSCGNRVPKCALLLEERQGSLMISGGGSDYSARDKREREVEERSEP